MEHRAKKKLMLMHKALFPRDDIDRLYVSKKRDEEDSPALKIVSIH